MASRNRTASWIRYPCPQPAGVPMTQAHMVQVTWNPLRTVPVPVPMPAPVVVYIAQPDMGVIMVLTMQAVLCSRLGAEASIEASSSAVM